MSAPTDPYREWLGISDGNRPLSHYQLLGLAPFEDNLERIEYASMIQMSKALHHEGGPHSRLVVQVCGELERATACLSDPQRKRAYDAELKQSQQAAVGFEVAAPTGSKLEELFGAEAALLRPAAATPASPETEKYLELDDPADDDFSVPALEEPVSQQETLASPSETKARPDAEKPGKSAGRAPPPPKDAKKGAKPAKPTKPRFQAPSLSQSGLLWPSLAVFVLVPLALYISYRFTVIGPTEIIEVDSMIAQLQSTDPRQRFDAAQYLRNAGPDEAAARQLVELLKQEQVNSVRSAAADALTAATVDLEPLLPELRLILSSEKNAEVKKSLQWAVDHPRSAQAASP